MYDHRKIKNTVVIYLSGRLDIQMSMDAEIEISEILAKYNDVDVLLHLKNLEYISSSGLRVLVALVRQLKEKDKILKLCELNASVRKTLEVVELLDLFNVYDTEEAAIN